MQDVEQGTKGEGDRDDGMNQSDAEHPSSHQGVGGCKYLYFFYIPSFDAVQGDEGEDEDEDGVHQNDTETSAHIDDQAVDDSKCLIYIYILCFS